MELLSGFGKRGIGLNLLAKPADILDTEFLSKYFVLQEFSPKLTAGKNSITFNGSDFLKQGSEIQVECIDSDGNPLYIESTTKTSLTYREASTYVLSIHVYNETVNGPGKLILYGVRSDNATVKWIGNIIIDKTLQNSSTVRFYKKPTLEVDSILSPVLATVGDLNKEIQFSGSFYSFAVNPPRDSLDINKKNVDIDYRLYIKNFIPDTDPTGSFNSQLIGSKIEVGVRTIQKPYSYNNVNTYFTSSFKVKKVINNSTVVIDDVISYTDSKKNNVVVNVVDGDFLIKYPYIVYNTASESSSYLTANTQAGHVLIKQSYANVIYRNLKTFSGFVARHKLYKKSLFLPEDFVLIADEPLVSYELLQDRLTTNRSFNRMGVFYNQRHVDRYWYVNGSLLQLTQSSARMIESMDINYTGPKLDLNSLSNYVMVKDNTSGLDRNSNYYPFDPIEFDATSGSSYDSNFIELKKDVNYLISLNVILKKDSTTINELDSGLEFYLTSSLPDINLEQNVSKTQKGLLKLGVVPAFGSDIEKVYTPYNILFNISHDLFGTIIIVPRKCTATISQLSLRPYGDYGFSPDILITKIPFPIVIPNEPFELKAELFDINSNLVYSDLRTVTSFDVSGSSLGVFIPGYQDPSKTTFISGNLIISKSLWVGENAFITGSLEVTGPVGFKGIIESSYTKERMMAWNSEDYSIRYTNVGNILNNGNNEIVMTLYKHPNSDEKDGDFRLIPSIEGRNIWVPPGVGQLKEQPQVEIQPPQLL